MAAPSLGFRRSLLDNADWKPDIRGSAQELTVRACCLLAVGCIVPALATAQVGPSNGRSPRRLVVLVLEGNQPTDDPMAEVAARMENAGYNYTSARECFIFCRGPTRHPHREQGGGFGIVARMTISQLMSAGVGATFVSLGSMTGLNQDGTYIAASWRTNGAWSALYWTPHPALRFGAGPAWFSHSSPTQAGFSQAGYILEAGAGGFRRSRLSVQIGARAYRMRGRHIPASGAMPLAVHANWSRTDLLGQLVWRF